MIKNMTKKDLKERMVVETREGNRYLVCGNSIIRDKGYCNFHDYNENLTTDFPALDIVKVYDKVSQLEEITSSNLELLWERKEHTPEVGDVYYDDTDDEKIIIIAIDENMPYPYITMNVYKDSCDKDSCSCDSNTYSKTELNNYKFVGTDVNTAKMFNTAFARLKDYKHE